LFYSTHLVTGAALGMITGSPVRAFLFGLLSHILLDAIPHHDYRKVRHCVIDIVGGTIVFALVFVFFRPDPAMLWGAIGGVVPDLEVPLHHFGFIRRRVFPSHNGLTPHSGTAPGRGIIIQLVVMLVGIWVLS
jgi:hypothetical protein